MPKVAIVAAMEREVRPLVKSWRVSEREHSGRAYRFFLSEAGEAVLVCGGIGAEAARRAAEAAIALYSPKIIYSVGFAGALEPALRVADVIHPAMVINATDGSRATLPEGTGVLVSFAAVASAEQKAKLRESYGAQIVDMEAAAVAHAAQARDVQFSVVKSISDEYDFSFPNMQRFVDPDGSFRQGRFAAFAAVRPWLWPKVIRMANNSHQAALALCDGLTQTLHRMVARAE